MYDNIKKLDKNSQEVNRLPVIINHFVDGAYLEISGAPERVFKVEFIDEKGRPIYVSELKGNMWSRLNKKYFVDTTCNVYENGELIYSKRYNAKGKNVLIALHSNSLGDTLAWLPYAEEFRKKHDCNLFVSTFKNELFKDQYPEINFVEPGHKYESLYANYALGWFYKDGIFNPDMHPHDFRLQPMQKTSSDILGLEYKEIRPRVKVPVVEKKKRVGLGIHSTAQAKYWNNPTGWQEVVDYLKSLDYEVVIYSHEGDGYMNNFHPKGVEMLEPGSLTRLTEELASCEFFIGIGSGLSWLAWSLNVPVVLISGFSDSYTEPLDGVVRVINKSSCNSCFNRHKLDPADWNWCPDHKGTPRMFECTKSITGQMVIDAMKKGNLIKDAGDEYVDFIEINDEAHVENLEVNFKNNIFTIKNNYPINLDKTHVLCRNDFSQLAIDKVIDLKPGEIVSLPVIESGYQQQLNDSTYYLKLIKDSVSIYDKAFNDKSKCFVLISNKKFEGIAEQLISGLSKYSTADILHYTLGYKSNLNYPNLQNINYSSEHHDLNDPIMAAFSKPDVFLDVINRGYRGAVYLDTDIQVRSDINTIFSYLNEIEDGPVMQKAPWDTIYVNGRFVPDEGLRSIIGITEHDQHSPYGVCNIIIFNPSHKHLFEEWRRISFSEQTLEVKKKEYVNDEPILNGLLWKLKMKPKLFNFAINVLGLDDVKFFYEFEPTDNQSSINLNDYGLGHSNMSYMPIDRDCILAFHCVKDVEIAKSINELVELNETNF